MYVFHSNNTLSHTSICMILRFVQKTSRIRLLIPMTMLCACDYSYVQKMILDPIGLSSNQAIGRLLLLGLRQRCGR